MKNFNQQNPESTPDSSIDQAPEGTSWNNPGDFPDFQGDTAPDESLEDKAEKARNIDISNIVEAIDFNNTDPAAQKRNSNLINRLYERFLESANEDFSDNSERAQLRAINDVLRAMGTRGLQSAVEKHQDNLEDKLNWQSEAIKALVEDDPDNASLVANLISGQYYDGGSYLIAANYDLLKANGAQIDPLDILKQDAARSDEDSDNYDFYNLQFAREQGKMSPQFLQDLSEARSFNRAMNQEVSDAYEVADVENPDDPKMAVYNALTTIIGDGLDDPNGVLKKGAELRTDNQFYGHAVDALLDKGASAQDILDSLLTIDKQVAGYKLGTLLEHGAKITPNDLYRGIPTEYIRDNELALQESGLQVDNHRLELAEKREETLKSMKNKG